MFPICYNFIEHTCGCHCAVRIILPVWDRDLVQERLLPIHKESVGNLVMELSEVGGREVLMTMIGCDAIIVIKIKAVTMKMTLAQNS